MAQVTARLDPHGPLVLDLRDLGRRAGSMQTVTRTVPAPADLGTVVIGAPEGSDIDLDVRLESLDDGVLVSGTARVRLVGECVRCLDAVEREFDARIQELFVHADRREAAEDEGDAEFEALPVIERDLIDLEPALRDAVVLDLPLSPVCRADCPGLCVECGARLADDPDHGHDVVDPRWAALASLADGADEGAGGGAEQNDQ
jgi:uncharacterized protein